MCVSVCETSVGLHLDSLERMHTVLFSLVCRQSFVFSDCPIKLLSAGLLSYVIHDLVLCCSYCHTAAPGLRGVAPSKIDVSNDLPLDTGAYTQAYGHVLAWSKLYMQTVCEMSQKHHVEAVCTAGALWMGFQIFGTASCCGLSCHVTYSSTCSKVR